MLPLTPTSADLQKPSVAPPICPALADVLGMWLDWRHADAGVGIGMPALVGPSWREGVGKRKTENEYFVKSSASRFPNSRGWIRIKKLALTNRFS